MKLMCSFAAVLVALLVAIMAGVGPPGSTHPEEVLVLLGPAPDLETQTILTTILNLRVSAPTDEARITNLGSTATTTRLSTPSSRQLHTYPLRC